MLSIVSEALAGRGREACWSGRSSTGPRWTAPRCCCGGSPGRARRRCWMPRRRRRRPQVTTAALSFIGAGIILHVGTGLRWPLVLKSKRDSW